MRLQTHSSRVPARQGRRHPAVLGILAVVATLAGSLVVSGDADAAPDIQVGSGLGSDFLPQFDGNLLGPFFDRVGLVQNATNNAGVVNARNAFFDTHLGTNGQACVTCHQPGQGFSLTTPFIQQRFAFSFGRDPLFRANSTADRPDADFSTLDKRRQAYQLFLKLGIVRIGKTLPAKAEFSIVSQSSARFGQLPSLTDPQAPGTPTLSVFRRPLATTNVRFDTAVLWDGRQNIHNLRTQVKAAARTLMLGPDVTDAQADAAASFMTDVFTAQDFDFSVGSLSARGAIGGVQNLKALATSPSAPCVPMTDPAQADSFVPPVIPRATGCKPVDPSGANAFTLYTAWLNPPQFSEFRSARMAVARGEKIFNERNLLPGSPAPGTCSGCHSTTNIGNNPLVSPNNVDPGFFIRLGLDSPDALKLLAALDPRMTSFVTRTADLPVYTLAGEGCPPGPFNTLPDPRTGQPIAGTTLRSTDPGRALVTGQCGDFGAFKPPILRGLQPRAPYFHNGAAETLDDVVNFYDAIFGSHLTTQEHNDLVAFLKAL
jgi:cytochrome c peroxidase